MTTVDGFGGWELIGRGGFSVVYRAHQPTFERDVAVKLLECDGTDADVLAAVDRECAAAGRLGAHPHIVTLFDRGVATDGRPYLVMELLPGGSLHQRVRTAPLAPAVVLDLATKIGGAVETSHRAGTLHRDIKPHNILHSAVDEPVLVDFGVAVVLGANSASMIPSGFTPAFAAPELLVGRPATVASDVYSLAATVYFAMCGEAPVPPDGESYVSFVGRVLSSAPEPPPGLSRRGRDALAAALAVQPTARPGSVAELVDELTAGRSGTGRSMVLLDDLTIDPDHELPRPEEIEGLGAAAPPPAPSRRGRTVAIAAVAAVVALVGGVLIGVAAGNDDRGAEVAAATTVVGATVPSPSTSLEPPPSPTSPPIDEPPERLRDLVLAMDEGSSTSEVAAEQSSPGPDRSAVLGLAIAGIPDLLTTHLGITPSALETPPDPERLEMPTRLRTWSANLRADDACRGLRTRELQMVGVAQSIWQQSGVYAVAYLWEFADHDDVSAEQQVADAYAAGALQLGASGEECTGFDEDGVALDGDVSVAYDDLAPFVTGTTEAEPYVIRSDTNVPIGAYGTSVIRYAHRMLAPMGDRLLRVDLYSAGPTPLSPSAVAAFLTATRSLVASA